MEIMYEKTYTGAVSRKLSEGHLSPSTLPEMYVEKTQNFVVDTSKIDTTYPSRIFNIIETKDSLEITSNTLGLNITNIVINGKAYFKKLSSIPANIEDLIDIDYVIKDEVVYLNTDKTYLILSDKLYTIYPTIGLDIFNINSTVVNLRRLKDRFSIKLKGLTKEDVVVEPKHTSVLEPNLLTTYAYFDDCIINTEGKNQLLRSHTYEYFEKVEIFKSYKAIELKDKPISDIDIEYLPDGKVKVNYTTFRSNMYINIENDVYVSLSGDAFILSKKQPSERDDILSIKRSNTTVTEMIQNPYVFSKVYDAKPESYYFTWDTTSKYNRPLDVPIGCGNIVLSKTKILEGKKNNFKILGGDFFESGEENVDGPTEVPLPPQSDSIALKGFLDFMEDFGVIYE